MRQRHIVVLMMLASTFAFAPSAAASASIGISCIAPSQSPYPAEMCVVGTVETKWVDCLRGDFDSLWYCQAESTLTYTVPKEYCAAARIGPYDWPWYACTAFDSGPVTTQVTYTSHHVKEGTVVTVPVDLCMDAVTLEGLQCARWQHVAGPAPAGPDGPVVHDPPADSEMTSIVDLLAEARLPLVGVGASVLA
jgi:hypothetical protein